MSKPIHLLVLVAMVWGCGNTSDATPNPSGEGESSGATRSPSGEGGSSAGASGSTGATTGAGGVMSSGGSIGSSGATDAGAGDGGGDATANDAGGASGGALPSYFLGADITDQEPAPAAAITDLLSQMKAHGFNSVRLRTFVDPRAADGYDKTTGFDDIAHTASFGKMIKDAGMGLLIDFHMSDNWADPGKQCVPVAWQAFTTITDLAAAVHDYTKDAITELIAGGARPDMVQIGNETTPGMLLHRCDSTGAPTGNSPIPGAATAAGWPSLGVLLKAGVAGVKEVDTGILVSLHIDRGNSFSTSKSWIDNVEHGPSLNGIARCAAWRGGTRARGGRIRSAPQSGRIGGCVQAARARRSGRGAPNGACFGTRAGTRIRGGGPGAPADCAVRPFSGGCVARRTLPARTTVAAGAIRPARAPGP